MTEKDLVKKLKNISQIDFGFDIEQGKQDLLKQLPVKQKRSLPLYPFVSLAAVLVLIGGLIGINFLRAPEQIELDSNLVENKNFNMDQDQLNNINTQLTQALTLAETLTAKSSKVVAKQEEKINQRKQELKQKHSLPQASITASIDQTSENDILRADLQLQKDIKELAKQKDILERSQQVEQLLEQAQNDYINQDFVLAKEKLEQAREIINNLDLFDELETSIQEINVSPVESSQEKVENNNQ